MDKIQEFLLARHMAETTKFWKGVSCKHKFKKYGLGYQCKYCKLYTGTSPLTEYVRRTNAR